MENTRAPEGIVDCTDAHLSKYYCVIVQYATKLNTDRIRKFLQKMNAGAVSSKCFNPRLCPEDVSDSITGYQKGAVCPLAMATDIPVIVSDKILALDPPIVILGGGHVDLKVEISVKHLLKLLQTRGEGELLPPFIVECAE